VRGLRPQKQEQRATLKIVIIKQPLENSAIGLPLLKAKLAIQVLI
jgi:hypothetical protein